MMSDEYKQMLRHLKPIDESPNHVVLDTGGIRHDPSLIVNDKVYHLVLENETEFFSDISYINYDNAIWSE